MSTITPSVGYVIKSRNTKTEEKVFINIVHHDKVNFNSKDITIKKGKYPAYGRETSTDKKGN